MRLSARLVTDRILVGAQPQDLAVTITAPGGTAHARPPLSLAIVLDRSGSMSGAPIENAKSAAISLLDQLDDGDAFAFVTFAWEAQTVLPMVRATPDNKLRAKHAIEAVFDDGGTCISCGLELGATEALHSPIAGGLRRLVLLSDGETLGGIKDPAELAQLAADYAARGISTSTVGVGLDFDEALMRRLAEVGHGNYYFVEDTTNLAAMFSRELGGLAATVASDLRLVVTETAGMRIEEAYGYPMSRVGSTVIVPVADLRAGESRKVVFRVTVSAAHTGPLVLAPIDLGWRRVGDGAQRGAHASVLTDATEDPQTVVDSVDPATLQAVEQARSARALEQAAQEYERTGYEGAKQVLDARDAELRASERYLDAKTTEDLQSATAVARDGFATDPAKAKKVTSVRSYQLAR